MCTLPYTPRGKALMARGVDYKLTALADRDEAEYAAAFYPHGLPDYLKPTGTERIRAYLTRVLRAAPDVVEWVDRHHAPPRRVAPPPCLCCPDWARRQFERRFTNFLVDYYFCEVGRCIALED